MIADKLGWRGGEFYSLQRSRVENIFVIVSNPLVSGLALRQTDTGRGVLVIGSLCRLQTGYPGSVHA